MADTKISDYSEATSLAATDLLVIAQEDTANKKATLATLQLAVGGLTSRETRSSNTILGVGDKGKMIDITAAITQTFTAAATLAAGWWVILRNATTDGTTVVTLDPNSSETIDGVATPRMYSGETRLIVCDGSNFYSHLLASGLAKFTTDGTFYVPAGATTADVVCIGGGGGGGGGRGGSAATYRQGGTGGGGGARVRNVFPVSALGSAGNSVTVTVAAGGAGGAGGSSSDGTSGTAGGNTSLGTLLVAHGGGYGYRGSFTGATSGGGGGGNGAAGVDGSSGDSLGGIQTSLTVKHANGGGGGSSLAGSDPGGAAEYGGGGGGMGLGTGV
ncbi:MAG: hypothetical protein OEW06_18125, partial [Gemmatimonadota bacterium]|nr:hypothetical protein [Gemmatimonadota bacterium]